MIVVGSTLAPYKCDGIEELWWLRHAEELRASAEAIGQEVAFFAALENVPGRREEFRNAYHPMLDRLFVELHGFAWFFSIQDGEEQLTSGGRIARICTGRNLIQEYALRQAASHILFADSDVEIPGDAIPKLLDVGWPIVGGEVPTYCLSGPSVEYRPSECADPACAHRVETVPPTVHQDAFGYPVQEHWNTAGFLLVAQDLFRRVRWGWDPTIGQTDDPYYAMRCRELGWPTLVRKDVVGHHHPEGIGPLETRGHDLRLR